MGLGRDWDGIGTGLERDWNGGGLERDWNRKGTGLERDWNGTIESLKCYCALPRKLAVTTLLHPAGASEYVDVPNALRLGNRYFLPADYTRPRSNQWRKWYHTKYKSRGCVI